MRVNLPESPRDTLMACFSLFLTGKETRKERNAVRDRLMNHLQHILNRDTEYFLNPAVRSLVRRLSAISPGEVPVSAEIFYIQNEQRLEREALTFLNQNRREGFVGDKFTFCYLFAELFQVDVHLYQPEEVILSVVPFARYHLHIQHKDNRFTLILPHVPAKRPDHLPFMGLQRTPSNVSFPQYQLNGEHVMVPPRVRGYRVHSLIVFEPPDKVCVVEPVDGKPWGHKDYGYVWMKTELGELSLLSCVSKRISPRFYLNDFPCTLYFVAETCIEDAKMAICVECSL